MQLSMPRASTSTLRIIEIILVPLDNRPAFHYRIRDGNEMIEPVAGDNEPTDVLTEMPRKLVELIGDGHDHVDDGIAGIDPDLAHALLGNIDATPTPVQAADHADSVIAQPKYLADIAGGTLGPVGNDVGGRAGATAATPALMPRFGMVTRFPSHRLTTSASRAAPVTKRRKPC